MASQTQICNLALLRIGHPSINSIDDGSKAANALKNNWDAVRDIVLRDHPWNFAIGRAVLAQLSETITWGFDYVYQLPADCVRVLGIADSDDADINPRLTYKKEGDKLYTDEDAVNLKYVRRIETTGSYDARFVSAFASRMAMEVGFYLTKDPNIFSKMEKRYELEISGARSIDAQEDTPQVIDTGPNGWEESRA